MLQLSERIINRTIRPLTNDDRKDVFIVDDTLFARAGGKKTELCSKVFDHVSMKYRKSMLHLGLGCHCLSYDALTAHVSLVFIRYMLLFLQKRRCEDDRTIGELFLLLVDELADTTFAHAMQLIVDVMLQQTVREHFGLSDEQLQAFILQFYNNLPASYRRFIQPPAAA